MRVYQRVNSCTVTGHLPVYGVGFPTLSIQAGMVEDQLYTKTGKFV